MYRREWQKVSGFTGGLEWCCVVLWWGLSVVVVRSGRSSSGQRTLVAAMIGQASDGVGHMVRNVINMFQNDRPG